MFFKKSPPIQPTPTVTAQPATVMTKPATSQGTTPTFKPQQPTASTTSQQTTSVVRPMQATPTQQPTVNNINHNQLQKQTSIQSPMQNQGIPQQTVKPIQKPEGASVTPTQTTVVNSTQASIQPTNINPSQGNVQTLNMPLQTTGTTQDSDKYAKPANYKPPVSTEKQESAKQDAPIMINTMEPHEEVLPDGKKVFKADSVRDVNFADLWYTPEGVAYIRDKKTKFALIPFETKDLEDFYKVLEQGYTGSSSYAAKFKGEAYRVERVMTTTGVQYNLRKMPVSTPNLYKLGIPDPITKYMATLAPESGLILFGGPTGMGKTTTASALMKEFLETHGGFLYTIEDPPEMPLDGLYYARNGSLGLCKQSPVENERWEDGLKSALRSKPRYILVGETRTAETAAELLRAATSGHLVISTIHANNLEDGLTSLIKYAAASGMNESLASDLS